MEPDPSLKTIPTRPDTMKRDRPKMGEKPMAGMFETKDRILANKQQYASEKKAVKQAVLAKAAAMKKVR